MKGKLSVKTLFRSWVKTVFTFILIAAVSFGLFSQIAEYVNTKREFESNLDMYYGFGSVEASAVKYKNVRWPYYIESDPRVDCFPLEKFNELRYEPITEQQIEAIGELPYVSSLQKRYMTGGVCNEFYRGLDWEHSYDYAARLVIEATLKEVGVVGTYGNDPPIHFEDFKILAGQAEKESISWDNDSYNLKVFYTNLVAGLNYYKMRDPPLNGFYANGNNLGHECGNVNIRVWGLVCQSYIYDKEYLLQLTPGNRYVFVVRFERDKDADYIFQKGTLYLSDFLAEPWCKAIWDVTDAPENYLELEEYAPLKKCIDITNDDAHTLDVVYTDDMSVIKQVANDNMRIAEGRWLTPEDTENKSPVCVISETFAKNNDLKIGDKMSLKLGDELFEQFYGLGAVAATQERYADNWTEETEFEIVGIYKDVYEYILARMPNWTYSSSTVFVPLSFLNLTEEQLAGHEFSPSEFNFRVDNAWEIEPFIEECIPKIEEMGLTVTFDDRGWMEISQQYNDAQKVAMIRLVLLWCVTIIATGLAVYLFISRKKKDYAIMRALGTPKKKAASSLLLPLTVLTVAGIAVGIISGIIYTYSTGNAVLPMSVVVCAAGEFALMLVVSGIMLNSIGKRSPLELLQGGSRQKQQEKTQVFVSETDNTNVNVLNTKNSTEQRENLIKQPKPKRKKQHHMRFVLRYISRHIRRSALKSLLTVLLAVLMVGAIAQFAQMKFTYAQLRENTVITPRFINALPLSTLPKLEKGGYAVDVYYEETVEADIHYGYEYRQINVAISNDFSRYTSEPVEIEYAPGYDESCLTEFGDVIFLGNDLMEAHGYELGDTITITPKDRMFFLMVNIQNEFSKTYPDLPMTDENIYEVFGEAINVMVDQMADKFVIAGVFTTPSNAFSDMAFTPGKDDIRALLGTGVLLDLAEFRLADNKLVKEMKEEGEKIVGGKSGSFLMDTSKLDSVIRTSDLLNSLYPVAVAAALIIGSFLCALIIIQTSKDAAIMRIQGTTKRKTRAILAIEQIVLTILGAVVGVLVMTVIKGAAFMETAPQTLVFAGVYIVITAAAAVISAVFATHKNILELLQTKE